MMKYYRQKNISDKDLSIPGIGIVKAGEEVELPEGFNNANFVKVKDKKKKEDKDEKDESKV